MRRIFSFHQGMPTLHLSFLIQALGALVLWFAHLSTAGQAQAAAPITSSGLNTQVTLSATPPTGKVQYNITGGTRPGGGTNLFHSFGDFNVPTNNIANFLNETALPTANILGRVTGGSISNIFGTIQTTGFGNANLFLMNPTGFLFGPNAAVNVGGMVAFTSADYLRLTDGSRFNAIPNAAADALLSAAPVAAFGFLGSNPGAITVQGSQLSVTPGQIISLIGGNITVQSGMLDDGITIQPARLSAPGGQINLASVASPGEILAGTLAQAPNMNGQSFGALGSIQISQQSVIDVSGNGGGTVLIRGGQFLVDNSTISANVTGPGPVTNGGESIGGGIDIVVSQDAVIQNGAVLETSVLGNATPGVTYGRVHVKADNIEIFGSQDFVNFPVTGVFSNVAKGSTGGNSGDIEFEGNSILMKDFGGASITFLQTRTNGAGNAGNIGLTSKGDLQIDNGQISSSSQGSSNSPASGNAGNIALTSTEGNISMTDTSQVAGTFVASSTIGLNTSGHVGNITVSAPAGDILLSDFASIFTHIDGTGNNTGRGGIQFTANNLTIQGSSGIQIDNFTPFQPGNLNVNLTGRLSISSTDPSFPSTLLTITRTSAQAAAVDITAHDTALTGNVLVSTETRSSGPGGPLNISSQTLQVTNGAQITSGTKIGSAGTPSGNGGTVTIQGLTGPTTDSVVIDGAGSGIFTNTVGTGAGGNISISANTLTVQNGGALSAATSGIAPTATGGAITVNANTVTLATGATMTATSTGAGAAGEITVQGHASPAQSILIDGAGSGIFTDTQGSGAGGNIFVNANSVTLQNGGTFSAATSGPAPTATGGAIMVNATNQVQLNNGGLITAATTGAGTGGSLTIGAGSTVTSNASTVSSTASQATGGGINITAGQSVTLTNGSSISASSTGAGNAGNIMINAGQSFLATNSLVTTQANQASGGTIKISTSPSGTVQFTNSTISASVLDGTGGGGSVSIDPQFVILQNSQILAQAVQGPGGNIFITTNLLLPDTTSVISASSQFGQNGTITIQSPISPAGGKILPLSQKPLLATTLLSQRCAALAGGEFSSFTVAGRDSLPAEPGGWLASPLALSISESSGGTSTEVDMSASLNEPMGGTPLLSLRQIAPPGFLTQAFAVDWSAGCTS